VFSVGLWWARGVDLCLGHLGRGTLLFLGAAPWGDFRIEL